MSRTDDLGYWQRVLLVLTPLGWLTVWLLTAVSSWQNAPDLGHSWIIPFLMAYLWWERWSGRPDTSPRSLNGFWWAAAVLIVMLALPVRLLLVPYPLWPLLLFLYSALLVGVAVLASWLIGGRAAVLWVGAPMILMVSALPIPAALETWMIVPVREFLAGLAAEMSNWWGEPALAVGTSLKLADDWVGVDEACGGIRSLQACLMVALFFGEWYRFGLGRRLLLVGLGVGLAIAGNFGRVLFLSFRAGEGLESVDAVHDLTGWVAMIASLAATGAMACMLGGWQWPVLPVRKVMPVTGLAPGWKWLAVVVAGLGLNEAGAQWWFHQGGGDQQPAIRWTARFPENHWSFVAQPLSEVSRDLLRPDNFTAGYWRLPSGATASSYFVEWKQGQVARSVPFAHNPTICLPMAGCELVAELEPIEVAWGGMRIPFAAYKFHRMGEYLLVVFTIWDPAKGNPLVQPRKTTTRAEWWLSRWRDVAEARRDQPAQLLTVTIPWDDSAQDRIHEVLRTMIVPAAAL